MSRAIQTVAQILHCPACGHVIDERHKRDGCRHRIGRRFFFGILAGAATSGILSAMAHEDVFDDPMVLRTGDKLVCSVMPVNVYYAREGRRLRPVAPSIPTEHGGWDERYSYNPLNITTNPETFAAEIKKYGRQLTGFNVIEAREPLRIIRIMYSIDPASENQVIRKARWWS